MASGAADGNHNLNVLGIKKRLIVVARGGNQRDGHNAVGAHGTQSDTRSIFVGKEGIVRRGTGGAERIIGRRPNSNVMFIIAIKRSTCAISLKRK